MAFLIFIFASFLFIYAELSLLVWLGSHLGVLALIGLLLLSSFVGIWIIRLRGWYSLNNLRKQLSQGEIPTRTLLQAVLWVLAGVLFLLPGLLTDILALLLLCPPTSLLIEAWLMAKIGRFGAKIFRKNHRTFYGANNPDSEIFDAEFEKQADEDKRLK